MNNTVLIFSHFLRLFGGLGAKHITKALRWCFHCSSLLNVFAENQLVISFLSHHRMKTLGERRSKDRKWKETSWCLFPIFIPTLRRSPVTRGWQEEAKGSVSKGTLWDLRIGSVRHWPSNVLGDEVWHRAFSTTLCKISLQHGEDCRTSIRRCHSYWENRALRKSTSGWDTLGHVPQGEVLFIKHLHKCLLSSCLGQPFCFLSTPKWERSKGRRQQWQTRNGTRGTTYELIWDTPETPRNNWMK